MGLEKAVIQNKSKPGEPFTVLFNPEQYTLERKNSFSPVTIHGLSSPLLQFSHGELKTLQMELFFDSREAHSVNSVPRTTVNSDVRLVVDKFLALMDIDQKLHAPPVLVFHWGSLNFQCVLASASQQYTMFKENGQPLRAKLNVSFQEFTDIEIEGMKIARQTADYTKVHTVGEGETLAGIAQKLYDDASKWRPIALMNKLTDPRKLAVGTKLLVPRLPYRDADSREAFE